MGGPVAVWQSESLWPSQDHRGAGPEQGATHEPRIALVTFSLRCP